LRGRIWGYNPWNFYAEPGDVMITFEGVLFLLYCVRGSGKTAAGELSERRIKPPSPDLVALKIGEEVWWVRERKT
jgi:hypothetical protein